MKIWKPQNQRVFKISFSSVFLWEDECPLLVEVVLLVGSSRVRVAYVQQVLFGNVMFSMDFCSINPNKWVSRVPNNWERSGMNQHGSPLQYATHSEELKKEEKKSHYR